MRVRRGKDVFPSRFWRTVVLDSGWYMTWRLTVYEEPTTETANSDEGSCYCIWFSLCLEKIDLAELPHPPCPVISTSFKLSKSQSREVCASNFHIMTSWLGEFVKNLLFCANIYMVKSSPVSYCIVISWNVFLRHLSWQTFHIKLN